MKQKKPERILSHAALLALGCTLELLLTPRRRAAEKNLTSADAGVGAPPDASLYISLAFVLSSLHLCWARRAAASRRSNPAGTFMTPVFFPSVQLLHSIYPRQAAATAFLCLY